MPHKPKLADSLTLPALPADYRNSIAVACRQLFGTFLCWHTVCQCQCRHADEPIHLFPVTLTVQPGTHHAARPLLHHAMELKAVFRAFRLLFAFPQPHCFVKQIHRTEKTPQPSDCQRLAKRAILQRKTARSGGPNEPFCTAKRAVRRNKARPAPCGQDFCKQKRRPNSHPGRPLCGGGKTSRRHKDVTKRMQNV